MADLGAVASIASGVLVALLGAAVVLANPRKDWNRVFGLLAGFWGVQIVALNFVRVAPTEDAARLAGEVGLVFSIPVYFFVAVFAGIFPRPRAPFGTSAGAVALLTAPAAASVLTLFLAPRLLIATVERSGEGFTLMWGPLYPYLGVLPFHAAFFYALHAMMRRLDEAESVIERRQVTFVLAALALYVAHHLPANLAVFGGAALGVLDAPEAVRREAAAIAVVMLVGLVILALVARGLGARLRGRGLAPERREAAWALAAIAAAFAPAVAFILVGLARGDAPGEWIDTLGVFRAGTVGLVVFAIARWQLFDVDLRVKRVAAFATAAVAGLAVLALAWVVLRGANVTPGVGVAVAVAVGLAAFIPLLRVTFRLADRLVPAVSPEGDHLYLRKLDVYRAAVEGALRDGRGAEADEPGLASLRAKLALTDRDHGIVVSLAATGAEPARAASPEFRPGAVVFGKYQVDSVLAEGGFGRVFLARDRILGRAVVVKELLAKWRGNANVVRTFLREAQIAGQLQHPNIVAVLAVEQHGQDYYVVMEFVPGGTLQDRLGEGTALPAPEAVRVASAILQGLAAAHARGVVHRDVKPANVLLGEKGEVKLADFGIAELTEDEGRDRTISGLTSGGFQPGTLPYMSPEQARGRPVDHRSDLYAVGAILHRMIAGRPHVAVRGLDELAARNLIAEADAPADVPNAPPALAQVVRRALAPDPEKRYATAQEMLDALRASG